MPKIRLNGPALWEFLLLVIVLVGLVWQFQGLKSVNIESLEDTRYLIDESSHTGPLLGYGQAKTDTLCQHVIMPPRLQWRWASACKDTKLDAAGDLIALPKAMQADYEAIQQAIFRGDTERQARNVPYSKSLAEGVLPDKDIAQLNKNLRESSIYREKFILSMDGSSNQVGSILLKCAWDELKVQANNAISEEEIAIAVANQMAFIRGAATRLWWPSANSSKAQHGTDRTTWSSSIDVKCRNLGLPQRVVSQAADMVEQVRLGERLQNKSKAMQVLQSNAPWLLIVWSMVTWILLSLVRLMKRPVRYLPVAIIVWAAVGAVSDLRLQDTGSAVSWYVWLGFVALACTFWLVVNYVPRLEHASFLRPCPSQRNVSFLTLPLFVFFVGTGWWLVFDLAINGHYRNRYIALTQSIPIFVAFVTLTIMPAISYGLSRLWVIWASLITNALRPNVIGRLGGWLRPVIIWIVYAVAIIGASLMLKNWRQFTGEAFRWWLLLGVSWFFLLRATRWGDIKTSAWRWLWHSMLPMFIYVLVVIGALVVTDDLGPLLVVLLASAVYLGAFASQAMLGRSVGWPASMVVGVVVMFCTAALLFGGLFTFSKLPISPSQRVAERVDSVLNPFKSENDQLAHVLWFQKHTPPDGYGLGAVPWCGTLPSTTCQGMPAQTQSDYTFSALIGVNGYATAFGFLIVYLLWLGLLAVRQAAQTQGRLNLNAFGATETAWLAWLAVCWVVLTVVQTLVTVMGNLGALPLTGVTWAFLSFGTWSLLGNAMFLGLVMHRLETIE